MKVERLLSIGKRVRDEKGVDMTRSLSHEERLSMVEDLRREMSKVTHREYPRRLRRVLEVAHRPER